MVENKPLLARLRSHPAAHTLEHIEKQQRSITPQPSTHHQSQPPSTGVLTPNNVSIIPSSNRSKRRNKTISQQDSVMSTPAAMSQELQLSANQSDSNGSTGFLRIQSPTSTVSSSTLRNQQTSNIHVNPLVSLLAQATGNTVRIIQTYVIELVENTCTQKMKGCNTYFDEFDKHIPYPIKKFNFYVKNYESIGFY